MKKILIAFLLFIFTAPAMALIVEGTIVDSQGPFIGAAIIESGTNHGNASDENGYFWITVDDPNAILEISSIGYETQRIKASDVKKDIPIVLQESYDFIEDVIVTPCTSEELHQQDLNASAGMWIGENARFNYKAYCKLTSCFDGFLLNAPNEPHPDDVSGQYTPNAKCIPCTEILPGSAENTVKDGKCFAKSCKCGYTLNNGTCIPWDENKPCTKQTKPALPANAKSAIMKCNGEAPYCEIVDCKDDTYVHNTDTNTCDDLDKKTCAEKDWNTIEHATGGTYERQTNGKILCKPTCDGTNYEAQRNSDKTAYECVPKTKSRVGKDCTKDEISRLNLDPNTTKAIVAEDGWDEATGTVTKCIIIDCADGFAPKDGTSCIDTKCGCGHRWNRNTQSCDDIRGTDCTAPNAHDAKIACEPDNKNGKELCKIQAGGCNDGYTLDAVKNVCVSTRGADCKGTLPADSHASVASLDKNQKCIIMACEDGYNLVGKGEKAKCEARNVASEQEVADLKANAQKMKENETSLVSRTIDTVGIGAVGIGGMMAAGALAEQAADAEAEGAMRAYLNTFRCEYGSGQTVNGGTIEQPLPVADLVDIRKTYAKTAYELQTLKQSLGKPSGIESEIPIKVNDLNEPFIATEQTYLYDDVGTGITGGNYASVARALTNPTGEDATRWNEQKEKTASNLKTGAITAGAGAAASLAANLAVNTRKDKQDKTDEILSKHNRTKPDEKTDASAEAADTSSAIVSDTTDVCKQQKRWYDIADENENDYWGPRYGKGIYQYSIQEAENDPTIREYKRICEANNGTWKVEEPTLADYIIKRTKFDACMTPDSFDESCWVQYSTETRERMKNVCGGQNTITTYACVLPDERRGNNPCNGIDWPAYDDGISLLIGFATLDEAERNYKQSKTAVDNLTYTTCELYGPRYDE